MFQFPVRAISYVRGYQPCIDVSITEDEVLEGDQTFTVILTTSDPNVLLGNNETTVIIMDSRSEFYFYFADHMTSLLHMLVGPDVSVSVPTRISVGEGDGSVQVCATMSAVEETERDFNITFSTGDSTGTYIHNPQCACSKVDRDSFRNVVTPEIQTLTRTYCKQSLAG